VAPFQQKRHHERHDADPDTGIRDLSIPDTLMRSFGHADCGVYAEVIEAGEVAVGDELGP